MPKQIFENGKLTIILDETSPKDRAVMLVNQYKGKILTLADKAALFDAYVEAGIIKL